MWLTAVAAIYQVGVVETMANVRNLICVPNMPPFRMNNGEYVPSGNLGEHLIPTKEQGRHIPHDWCECKPHPYYFYGRLFYRHSRLNYVEDLLSQAEDIRMAVSIQLWDEAEREGKPFTVVPFPAGTTQVSWPQPAKKDGESQ